MCRFSVHASFGSLLATALGTTDAYEAERRFLDNEARMLILQDCSRPPERVQGHCQENKVFVSVKSWWTIPCSSEKCRFGFTPHLFK
jgi:hypothetical protein